MSKVFVGMLLMCAAINGAFASTKGKVLVVLSSQDKITLKDGVVHPTGFFLPELMGPVKALLDAGYEPVFASPEGTKPTLDKVSDNAFYYGDVSGASDKARQDARDAYQASRALCETLELCGPVGTLVGSLTTHKLSDIRNEGLDNFSAVFFPGGHAPMEDLWKDADVKEVLKYFHASNKPTALICHAPISLLAALDRPEVYIQALISDDRATMVKETRNWIYRDYAVAVFTTREEQQEEPGEKNALGGFVQFYADAALERAGAFVSKADRWKSNVVRDRELITGQNPFSHEALATALVKALEEQGN